MRAWHSGSRAREDFARDLTDFMLPFFELSGSIYTGATKFVAYTICGGFCRADTRALLAQSGLRDVRRPFGSAFGYLALALSSFIWGLHAIGAATSRRDLN